jgi:hypothetical protein
MLRNDEVLKALIAEKTAELAEPVVDFTTNYEPIYDTPQDIVNDAECRAAYLKAVRAIDEWMFMAMKVYCFGHDANSFDMLLQFPDGNRRYSLKMTVSGVVNCTSVRTFNTTIGILNYFMYKCITDIKDNPVQIFYKAINEQIHRAEILISLDQNKLDPNDTAPTESNLKECGISDPLEICRMAKGLKGIEQFFEEDCYAGEDLWL